MRDWIFTWKRRDRGHHGVTVVRATNLDDALKAFYESMNKVAVEILSIDSAADRDPALHPGQTVPKSKATAPDPNPRVVRPDFNG